MTPRTIQKSNITEKLDQAGQTKIFIIEEAIKSCFTFFTGNCENITILFHFNILPIYNDSV